MAADIIFVSQAPGVIHGLNVSIPGKPPVEQAPSLGVEVAFIEPALNHNRDLAIGDINGLFGGEVDRQPVNVPDARLMP